MRIRVMDLRGEDRDQFGQVDGYLAARFADCFVCSGKLDQLDTELKVTNAYLHVCWGTAQAGVDKRKRKKMIPLAWRHCRVGYLLVVASRRTSREKVTHEKTIGSIKLDVLGRNPNPGRSRQPTVSRRAVSCRVRNLA